MKNRNGGVVDDYHGTLVADPYRALEDGDSPEVRRWTEEQTARLRAYIDRVGGHHERLLARAHELLRLGFVGLPVVRQANGRRRYFHVRREGTQVQPVLCVRDGLHGEDRVLLDPSTLSADGTTALDWWHPSMEGELVAWGRSEDGSEESTLLIRDVATGQDLPDRIPHTQFASVAWCPGGRRLFYTRYPTPGTVPPGDERYFSRIYEHVVGADPREDRLVFGEGRDKVETCSVEISPNGRWLVASVHKGAVKTDVYVRDLHAAGAPWRTVVEGIEALHEAIVHDDCLYLLTNDGHPRYRLVRADYSSPGREHWQEILPEGEDVLTEVVVVGGELWANTMHDAASRIRRFSRDGRPLGEIELPSLGSASLSAPPAPLDDEVFVSFTSFTTPFEVLRADVTSATKALELWDRAARATELPDVEVRHLYAISKDGTRVPMFMVERAGTRGAGPRPTVLYGYGGFNINQTPAFSVRALLAIENGSVWVSSVLRGGGELGEDWHRAGMLANKQNVFDDFIACAETLVAEGITTPDRLGMFGGSNGGLLVAAVATQRPDLFRAGVSAVPLTDMLRYHRFRIGKLWIPEYGDPDDPNAFPYLYAYSPYHRVVDGTVYPAMLFVTAESDSRVDPMHARKMAARMQEAQGTAPGSEPRPILLRVESKAGHGAGKPMTKVADEIADEITFLLRELGAIA